MKWLLDNDVFPFTTYMVEYGNEDENGFDIRASGNGESLVGEAFNVAPSFFQTKKASVLKKLRKTSTNYKLIMFNHDAVEPDYRPKPANNEFFVARIGADESCMIPDRRPLRRLALHPLS